MSLKDRIKALIEKEVISPGTYEAVVVQVKPVTYSSGNQGLRLSLMIRPDIEQLFQGEEVTDQVVFTENSIYRWEMIQGALEISDNDWKEDEELISLLLGKATKIVIVHEEYQGRQMIRIKSYYAGKPIHDEFMSVLEASTIEE
ncbi:hypothetical protein D3C73_378540 [compost metagenome]